MTFRYLAMLALTSLAPFLTAAPHRTVHPVAVPTLRDIYSVRALRRARIILQLKMLELRAQHLEQVRRALQRGIPIDRILQMPP